MCVLFQQLFMKIKLFKNIYSLIIKQENVIGLKSTTKKIFLIILQKSVGNGIKFRGRGNLFR